MKKKISTPIADFIRGYDGSSVRMHMPGHKGKDGFYSHDITEIDGADELYFPTGIIAASEENASKLFSARTFYSAEGSSLSIRTMVRLAVTYARSLGREPLIAAGRGVHKSFISAVALNGASVDWLCPESSSYMSTPLSRGYIEEYFKGKKEKPIALYITSPDYLGNLQDVKEISELCHENGTLLLVDNAHGAYLKFLEPSLHPIDLGADMCADSAHKTLPVLTGGGYLHVSKNAPSHFRERAKDAMLLFGSTSPSYLILESLDLANGYLGGDYRERLSLVVKEVASVKAELERAGYRIIGSEPMKIALDVADYGYSGSYVYEYLKDRGIIAEFADGEHIVFMPSEKSDISDLKALESALLSLPRREAESRRAPRFSLPKRAMSICEAMNADSELLPLGECLGRVVADIRVGCPPAVAPIVPGEIVDENISETLAYYGISELYVVK